MLSPSRFVCVRAVSSTQRSVADRAKALPLRLAGDVNNDMAPLDDRGDHDMLLVLGATPKRVASKRRQGFGVERGHGGSPRPPPRPRG